MAEQNGRSATYPAAGYLAAAGPVGAILNEGAAAKHRAGNRLHRRPKSRPSTEKPTGRRRRNQQRGPRFAGDISTRPSEYP